MSESKLREHLTDRFTALGCGVTNIENTYAPGTPDMFVKSPIGGFWLELKYIGATSVEMRTKILAGNFVKPSQRLWLSNHSRVGEVSEFILLHVEHVNTLFMIKGSDAYNCAEWDWHTLPLRCHAVIPYRQQNTQKIIDFALSRKTSS